MGGKTGVSRGGSKQTCLIGNISGCNRPTAAAQAYINAAVRREVSAPGLVCCHMSSGCGPAVRSLCLTGALTRYCCGSSLCSQLLLQPCYCYGTHGGCMWPSRGRAWAASTRGWALAGPGPISRRWGTYGSNGRAHQNQLAWHGPPAANGCALASIEHGEGERHRCRATHVHDGAGCLVCIANSNHILPSACCIAGSGVAPPCQEGGQKPLHPLPSHGCNAARSSKQGRPHSSRLKVQSLRCVCN
jgi:hypothetical protein